MPFTYAYDDRPGRPRPSRSALWLDVAVVVGVTLLALALGAATLRRRTPRSPSTAAISLSTDSFASPNSIVVFGSR